MGVQAKCPSFSFSLYKKVPFSPLKVTDVEDFVQLKHEGGFGRNEIIPLYAYKKAFMESILQ